MRSDNSGSQINIHGSSDSKVLSLQSSADIVLHDLCAECHSCQHKLKEGQSAHTKKKSCLHT